MIFAVVDLGSFAISGMLAKKDEMGQIIPLTYATVPSQKAILRGKISNVEEFRTCIKKVLDELNGFLKPQNLHIRQVYIGLNSQGIQSHSEEETVLLEEQTPISQEMIDKAWDKLNSFSYEGRDMIYRNRPIFYIPERMTNPLGEICKDSFQIKYTLVSAKSDTIHYIRKIIEDDLRLKIASFFPNPLAEFKANMNIRHNEAINCFVNMGGGTTSISTYRGEDLERLYIYPFGGINISKDILLAFKMSSLQEAEELKLQHAQAMNETNSNRHKTIPISEDKEISLSEFDKTVSARLREIIKNIRHILDKLHNTTEQQNRAITISGATTGLTSFEAFARGFFAGQLEVKPKLSLANFSQAFLEDARSKHFDNSKFATLVGLILLAKEDCVETRAGLSELFTSDETTESQTNSPIPKKKLVTEEPIDDEFEEDEDDTDFSEDTSSKSTSKFKQPSIFKKVINTFTTVSEDDDIDEDFD